MQALRSPGAILVSARFTSPKEVGVLVPNSPTYNICDLWYRVSPKMGVQGFQMQANILKTHRASGQAQTVKPCTRA